MYKRQVQAGNFDASAHDYDAGEPGQPLVAVETAPVNILSTAPMTEAADATIGSQDVYGGIDIPVDHYLVYADTGEAIANLNDVGFYWTSWSSGEMNAEWTIAVDSDRGAVQVATMVDGEQVITNSSLSLRYSYGLNDLAKTFEVPESVAGSTVQFEATGSSIQYKWDSNARTYERSDLFLLDGDGKVVGFAQTDDSGTGAIFEIPEGASGYTVVIQPPSYYISSRGWSVTEADGATVTAFELPLGEASGPGFTWTEDSEGVYTVATDELEHGFAGDLTVTITDAAGNVSASSDAVTVAGIDLVAPSVVSFTTDHQAGDHIRAGETVAITATLSEACLLYTSDAADE